MLRQDSPEAVDSSQEGWWGPTKGASLCFLARHLPPSRHLPGRQSELLSPASLLLQRVSARLTGTAFHLPLRQRASLGLETF